MNATQKEIARVLAGSSMCRRELGIIVAKNLGLRGLHPHLQVTSDINAMLRAADTRAQREGTRWESLPCLYALDFEGAPHNHVGLVA